VLHWGLDRRDAPRLLAAAEGEYRRRGVPLLNPRIVGKWRQIECFRAAAVPVPDSALVATADEAARAAAEIGYPVVLKPLYGSYSSGVVLARGPHELRRAWQPRHRLVQRYLPDGNRCARLLVVGDRVTHAVIRAARDGFPATYDHGRMAVLEPFVAGPGDESIAVAAAKAIGVSIGGVDLVQTPTGPLVLEVNHRGVEFHVAALHGADALDQVAEFVRSRAA
jgi:ribosomal protein S6--L-glutamate ligase